MKPTAANEIRRQVLEARDALSPEERKLLSQEIHARLLATDFFKKARKLLVYVSFRSEVETTELITKALQMDKEVYAPITDKAARKLHIHRIEGLDQLRPGAYGILEPDPAKSPGGDPSELDLVLVPGSVFSLRCGRFGYGGGFYDRFLSTRCPKALRTGLCFEIQLLDEIPLAPHDEPMDYIVTEERLVHCSRQGRRG